MHRILYYFLEIYKYLILENCELKTVTLIRHINLLHNCSVAYPNIK